MKLPELLRRGDDDGLPDVDETDPKDVPPDEGDKGSA